MWSKILALKRRVFLDIPRSSQLVRYCWRSSASGADSWRSNASERTNNRLNTEWGSFADLKASRLYDCGCTSDQMKDAIPGSCRTGSPLNVRSEPALCRDEVA